MEENDCLLINIQSTLMSTLVPNVEKRQVTPFKSSQCGECCSLRWCSGLFVGTWCPCTGGAVGHVGDSSRCYKRFQWNQLGNIPSKFIYIQTSAIFVDWSIFPLCWKGLAAWPAKKNKNHQQLDIGRLAGYIGPRHEFNCQGKGHARGPICWWLGLVGCSQWKKDGGIK